MSRKGFIPAINIPILTYRIINYLRYIPPRVPQALWSSIKTKAPICCMLNYILDRIMLVPSGLVRGYKRSQTGRQYVPCIFHTDER